MISATMPFYYAILEQYYTGELILPEINGIDDGSFVYIGMCFLAGYYGPKNLFYKEFDIFGTTMQFRHLMVVIMTISAFL